MARKSKQKEPKKRHLRVVSRGDGFHVIAVGRRKHGLHDMYARLLGATWRHMIGTLVSLYLIINVLFAFAYLATGDGIANARPGSFADAFFFSVQTIATIGYGGLLPKGTAANMLVTIESMFGFAFYAIVTGLVFSRFARPTARVMFSERAVIGNHNGKPHFVMRLANERNNSIVDARVKLTLMRDEVTAEGTRMRRFHDLQLVRSEIPVLRLTWSVMHLIDEKSPLHGMSKKDLEDIEAEVIVSLKGIDETLSQTIHARHSYIADEIVCNASFEDILHRREDYVVEVRYDKFHNIKENQQESKHA
jgi:inward rectifier potassium channel